jgi:hypothetical protein
MVNSVERGTNFDAQLVLNNPQMRSSSANESALSYPGPLLRSSRRSAKEWHKWDTLGFSGERMSFHSTGNDREKELWLP